MENVPNHIAIIMDGNGRWAQKRGLPRSAGHLMGSRNIFKVVENCVEAGVKILTLYAFSTENWKRPEAEVNYLMKLIPRFCKKYAKTFEKNDIRLTAIGRLHALPEAAREALQGLIQATTDNKRFTVNIAINYGGRAEIIDAVNALIAEHPEGPVTEEQFASKLYAPFLPDPDLLIRTGGEMRISNFLLWELSYSELYVTDTLWPDFDKKALALALEAYASRDRRYGGVKTGENAGTK